MNNIYKNYDVYKLIIDIAIVAFVLLSFSAYVLLAPYPMFGDLGKIINDFLFIIFGSGLVALGIKVNNKLLSLVIICIYASYYLSFFVYTGFLEPLIGTALLILFGWRLTKIVYGGYITKMVGILTISVLPFYLFGVIGESQPTFISFGWFLVMILYRLNYKPKTKKLSELISLVFRR